MSDQRVTVTLDFKTSSDGLPALKSARQEAEELLALEKQREIAGRGVTEGYKAQAAAAGAVPSARPQTQLLPAGDIGLTAPTPRAQTQLLPDDIALAPGGGRHAQAAKEADAVKAEAQAYTDLQDKVAKVVAALKERKELEAELARQGIELPGAKGKELTAAEEAAKRGAAKAREDAVKAESVKQGFEAGPKTVQDKARAAIAQQHDNAALQREIKRQGGAPTGQAGGAAVQGLDKALGTDLGGILGKVALPAAAAYAAIALVSSGLESMAKIADIAGNSTMTQAQKDRAIGESIPIIGGLVKAIHDLDDAASGTNDRLRRTAEAFLLINAATAATASANMDYQASVRRPEIAAEAKVEGRKAGVLELPKAPADVMDERQRRAYTRQLEVAGQLPEAKREKATQQQIFTGHGARATEARDQALTRAANVRGHVLEMDKAVAGENNGGGRNKAGIDEAIKAAQQEINKQLAEEKMLRSELQAMSQAKIAAVQAEGQIQDALLNKDRERLAVLKEQEEAVHGQNVAFGGLDEGQKMQAEQAAAQVKEQGFDSLAVEQKRALQAAGQGEYVNRENAKQADADPRQAAIRDALGGQQGDEAGLHKKVQALEGEMKVKLDFNKGELEKAAKEAIEDMKKDIADSIKRVAAAEKVKAAVEQAQNRNAR